MSSTLFSPYSLPRWTHLFPLFKYHLYTGSLAFTTQTWFSPSVSHCIKLPHVFVTWARTWGRGHYCFSQLPLPPITSYPLTSSVVSFPTCISNPSTYSLCSLHPVFLECSLETLGRFQFRVVFFFNSLVLLPKSSSHTCGHGSFSHILKVIVKLPLPTLLETEDLSVHILSTFFALFSPEHLSLSKKLHVFRLPWWRSGWESAC